MFNNMNSPKVKNSLYFQLFCFFFLFVERIEIQMKTKKQNENRFVALGALCSASTESRLKCITRQNEIPISHWIPASYFTLSLISLFECTHTHTQSQRETIKQTNTFTSLQDSVSTMYMCMCVCDYRSCIWTSRYKENEVREKERKSFGHFMCIFKMITFTHAFT